MQERLGCRETQIGAIIQTHGKKSYLEGVVRKQSPKGVLRTAETYDVDVNCIISGIC